MTRISDLPNFGPKSQQMLAQAGIHTVEQLRELGAVLTAQFQYLLNNRLDIALANRHYLTKWLNSK